MALGATRGQQRHVLLSKHLDLSRRSPFCVQPHRFFNVKHNCVFAFRNRQKKIAVSLVCQSSVLDHSISRSNCYSGMIISLSCFVLPFHGSAFSIQESFIVAHVRILLLDPTFDTRAGFHPPPFASAFPSGSCDGEGSHPSSENYLHEHRMTRTGLWPVISVPLPERR